MPRPRAVRRGNHARVYVPSWIQDFKFQIQLNYKQSQGAMLLDMVDGSIVTKKPVSLETRFIFPRPKNKIWKKKPMPREIMPYGKDGDNLLKTIMDALNNVAYHDDSQVWRWSGMKLMASGDESAHTLINLTIYDPNDLGDTCLGSLSNADG